MTAVQIRPTLAADVTSLAALEHSTSSDWVWQLELRREANSVSAAFREARLPRSTNVQFPRDPQNLLSHWMNYAMMYTALVDERPVGYVCATEREPASTLWISALVVALPRRRQGIGAALLETAQTWAQQKLHRRLILEAQSKNIAMIRLAQKFGCEFCGYNDQDYPTQDIALYFAKRLR
ncbi:MAG: hypothetical protein Fur002_01150 [Anaerolineales bacterium]